MFQATLDEGTEPWGVMVERVEVKDVRVPEQLQRAMAAEAEAARNARAKVIAAEGEHKASRSLRQAAEVITDSPAALQVISRDTHMTIKRFTFQAPVSANAEQYFCRAQQHYRVPCANRHHLELHALAATDRFWGPTAVYAAISAVSTGR